MDLSGESLLFLRSPARRVFDASGGLLSDVDLPWTCCYRKTVQGKTKLRAAERGARDGSVPAILISCGTDFLPPSSAPARNLIRDKHQRPTSAPAATQ